MAVNNSMAEGIVTRPDGIVRKNDDIGPGPVVAIYGGLDSAWTLCGWTSTELATIHAAKISFEASYHKSLK